MQKRAIIWERFARNRKSDKNNQQFTGVPTLDFSLDQESDLKANIPVFPICHVFVHIIENSWNIQTEFWM